MRCRGRSRSAATSDLIGAALGGADGGWEDVVLLEEEPLEDSTAGDEEVPR